MGCEVEYMFFYAFLILFLITDSQLPQRKLHRIGNFLGLFDAAAAAAQFWQMRWAEELCWRAGDFITTANHQSSLYSTHPFNIAGGNIRVCAICYFSSKQMSTRKKQWNIMLKSSHMKTDKWNLWKLKIKVFMINSRRTFKERECSPTVLGGFRGSGT